jgi:hypothetical protein
MSAATLVVGRTMLKQVRSQEIRNYILFTQAQSWDDALGPETNNHCPRVPYSVRRYYERIHTYFAVVTQRTLHPLIEHKDIYRVPRPMSLILGNGGTADVFLSAILWAAFQKDHAHSSIPHVPEPKVGDTVRVVRPKDPRLHQMGRIVSVSEAHQGAMVKFVDGSPEALSFNSFTVNDVMYPFPGPPPLVNLPKTCKTVLVKMLLEPALTLLKFKLALPSVEHVALKNGYRVLAMIVKVPRHAIAAFPCVTFRDSGWMFCNTWRDGEGARCQTLEQLGADLGSRQMAIVENVSVLYQRL